MSGKEPLVRSASRISQLQLLLPERRVASWLKEGVWLSILLFTALLPRYLLLPLLLSHSFPYWQLWISPEHNIQPARPKSEPVTSPRMSYHISKHGRSPRNCPTKPPKASPSLTTSAGLTPTAHQKAREKSTAQN